MVLIIGGAHQGKLDFAKENFSLSDGDVFICEGASMDFSRRCVYGIEEFTWACVEQDLDPIAYFRDHRMEWENSILICRDIFCGVVPKGRRMLQYVQQSFLEVRFCEAFPFFGTVLLPAAWPSPGLCAGGRCHGTNR